MEKSDQRPTIYSTIIFNIQCPKIIKEINIAKIFGTKVNVCSWILVTVWKILTISPTTKETNKTGAAVIQTT